MANDSPVVIIYGTSGSSYEEVGTSVHPFRTDPTGSTTQPTKDAADGTVGSTVPTTAQLVGLSSGSNLLAAKADEFGLAKVGVGGVGTGGFYPDYYDAQPGPGNHEEGRLLFDSTGNVKVRAPVFTDEGSIRDDFPGTSLDANCTGTATFINGSYDVVGIGTAFTTELSRFYMIRSSVNNASYAVRISDIIDDTNLVLTDPYQGTSGSGIPIKSVWSVITGSGGAIVVTSSILTISSGSINGSWTYAHRLVDYGPMVCSFYASVSQRIVSQEIHLGLVDSASISQQACIILDGTDNTKLKLRTGNSANVTDMETSAATTIPNSGTTATYHWYRIEIASDSVAVFVDGIFCIQNTLHIPDYYATLGMVMGIENTGTPASSTNLLVNVATTNNFNLVQVSNSVASEPTHASIGGLDNSGTFRQGVVKNLNPAPNNAEYGLMIRPVPMSSSTSSVTQVASSASNVTLLNANAARQGAAIFNLSTQVLYCKLGSASSATSFTVRIASNGYYEVPFWYTGIITGTWNSANGNAYVTELTL